MTATATPVGTDGSAPLQHDGPRSRRGLMRRQLPVASPVSVGAVVSAAFRIGLAEAREALADLIGREYAADRVILCSSGTHALQLAIAAAWRRMGKRGHIALPSFACYDLATAALGAGAPVDFFDVDPLRLAPDASSLERALRGGACVVVVAPLYGVPVDWAELSELCDRYGAVLIEDAAQGHGSLWAGQPLGSHGTLSVLSFGRGKGWSGGGGGALLIRGDTASAEAVPPLQTAHPVSHLSTVAKLGAQWAIGRPTLYGFAAAVPGLHLGETVYHPPSSPGQMTAANAAVALRHHSLSLQHAGRRRAAAEWWEQSLMELDGFSSIPVTPGGVGGYLRFPLLTPAGMDGFNSASLALLAGIAPSYPQPLPRLQQLAPAALNTAARWPGAERLAGSLVTLPTHWQVSSADRARVLDLLRSYQNRGTVR